MARAWWWAAAAAGGLALAGCASFNEALQGWRGDSAAAARPTIAAGGTDVFYAGSDGLTLHELPSGTSPIVTRLALHQPMTRINLARGYAQVRTESGLEGWVDSAELLWRLPATPAAPVPVPEAAAPPPPQVADTPGAPAAIEAAPPGTPPPAQPTPTGWRWRNLFPGGADTPAAPAPTEATPETPAAAPPPPPVADTPVAPAATEAAPPSTPTATASPPTTTPEAMPETPVGAAPASTPTAMPQPTPTSWRLRNLFPRMR